MGVGDKSIKPHNLPPAGLLMVLVVLLLWLWVSDVIKAYANSYATQMDDIAPEALPA